MNNWRLLPSQTWFFLAVLTGLMALIWPVGQWLWAEWWSNEYYSHGPLLLLVTGYLSWRAWERREQRLPEDTGVWSMVLFVASLMAYLWAWQSRAYYLAAFAVIGLLMGVVWHFGGVRMARSLAFPLGFLALAIPLPFIERATLPLALWTGACSGALVQWMGLDAVIQGASITLPNAELVVGAQCSGINSMITLLALSLFVAYILQGPWWGRLLLVLASLPLALLGNILRVTNLLYVARYLGVDAAFDFYHLYSGPIFFVLVLLLFVPLSRLLRCASFRYEVL
jgi:exosortase